MSSAHTNRMRQPANKLCISCRRPCKQAAHAVVAQCPRYYPYNRRQTRQEFTWTQLELGF